MEKSTNPENLEIRSGYLTITIPDVLHGERIETRRVKVQRIDDRMSLVNLRIPANISGIKIKEVYLEHLTFGSENETIEKDAGRVILYTQKNSRPLHVIGHLEYDKPKESYEIKFFKRLISATKRIFGRSEKA